MSNTSLALVLMSQRTATYCPLGSTTVTSLWDEQERPFLDYTRTQNATRAHEEHTHVHVHMAVCAYSVHALVRTDIQDAKSDKSGSVRQGKLAALKLILRRIGEETHHDGSWKLQNDLLFVGHSDELGTQSLKNKKQKNKQHPTVMWKSDAIKSTYQT